MDLHLKDELNPEQYRAASTLSGPLLIIAGAGSGKTRMITYRIAYMLSKGIAQRHILGLTFTNKAAREMADRVSDLLGKPTRQLTLSTFHAFGLKVLQEQASLLGFEKHLTVYDAYDVTAMIKESARALKMSVEQLDFYSICGHFSRIKTGLDDFSGSLPGWKQLYREYNKHLRAYNAVDFDDLLMLPIKLFEEHPEVLETYRQRYTHILVDEFQDTSRIQYRLLYLLAQEHRNLCVVGDDDQSIYSWRGANYENITDFERDFPEVQEIKLEQNYRCTGNILSAANTVIAHNTRRKSKSLWTGSSQGYPLYLHHLEHETEEAEFITAKIKELRVKKRLPYGSFGILVRTNSLMSTLESELMAEGIPYAVSGGQSFFSRKEIKDVISYLRVLARPHSDIDFLRIINTPRRGIGRASVEQIRSTAREGSSSLFSAAKLLVQGTLLKESSRRSLQELLELIQETSRKILKGPRMASKLKDLLEQVEYRLHLLQEHPKNPKIGQWRWDQVLRFLQYFSQWEEDPDTLNPSVFDYLNRISLTGKQEPDTGEGQVSLMTIHASKGLEFDCVFLPAVEDLIIPHGRSLEDDPGSIEEERRLFYVALTRARKSLYLSTCSRRRIMREDRDMVPSPFLNEIPQELFGTGETDQEVPPEESRDLFNMLRSRLG